jgi:hypothetical protein
MLPTHSEPSCGPPITCRSELTAWLGRARPGDRVVYHQGFLVVDCGSSASLHKRERRRLGDLATAVRAAAASGVIHLVQERLGKVKFSYMAVKAHWEPGGGRAR